MELTTDARAKTDYNIYNLGVCLRAYRNAISDMGEALLVLDREGVLEGSEDLEKHLYHFVSVDNIKETKEILGRFIREIYPTVVALFPDRRIRHEALRTLIELMKEEIEATILAEFPDDIKSDPIFRMGYDHK